MINPEPQDSDAELERQIDHQAWLISNVSTEDEKTSAWHELKRLHSMRSPERVAQMEREAGLR
jgi:hypothetical protein